MRANKFAFSCKCTVYGGDGRSCNCTNSTTTDMFKPLGKFLHLSFHITKLSVNFSRKYQWGSTSFWKAITHCQSETTKDHLLQGTFTVNNQQAWFAYIYSQSKHGVFLELIGTHFKVNNLHSVTTVYYPVGIA